MKLPSSLVLLLCHWSHDAWEGAGAPIRQRFTGEKRPHEGEESFTEKGWKFPQMWTDPNTKALFWNTLQECLLRRQARGAALTGGNLLKPHHLARLSWIVAPSRGRRRRQFLGPVVSFLKYLTHLLVFWSRSWKESVAVLFLLTFIVQTAHDGLAAASSCWYLLSACCHCPGRILMGNFQVFKIANNFFAKLNFDWKECQGYLCTDEMSALKLWQHIWLWRFDKARRPACTGLGPSVPACIAVKDGSGAESRLGKPAIPSERGPWVTTFSGGFAMKWSRT